MAHKKKMNAAALAAYKTENENFLANLRGRTGIQELRCGVLYKVVQTAPAPPADADERTLRRHNATPAPRSVVTVHYEGRLIDGQVFDSSRRGAGTPPAFRVNELSPGGKWRSSTCTSATYGSSTFPPLPATVSEVPVATFRDTAPSSSASNS